MATLQIVIGDQNLSSWSMRPWLALKASGLPHKQIKILLDRPDTARKIAEHSPTGKVPALRHGDLTVWDSLAICEYIAELAPDKNLWPQNPQWRALARSYVAEMHSGFHSLRNQCGMDINLKINMNHLLPQTVNDIQRITAMWSQALKMSGGPYLFGEFGIVDAFFAPVVTRFETYGIDVRDPQLRRYIQTVLKNPHMKEWIAGAKKEKPYRLRF